MDIDYENPWIFNGHPFLSEDINDNFGFVYRITNLCTGKITSEGSTFTNYENLEVEVGELKVKATGKNTTEDSLTNLIGSVVNLEITPFSREKSYPSTLLREKSTLKRPANSSYTVF